MGRLTTPGARVKITTSKICQAESAACHPNLPSVMIDIDQMQHSARCAVKLLKAMSNETRMMILCELLRGERSVGQLEERIGVSQSVLSQHLARLRRYALVRTRRSSQSIYYSLNGTEVPVVIEALYRLFCEDAVKGQAPGETASRKAALQEA